LLDSLLKRNVTENMELKAGLSVGCWL